MKSTTIRRLNEWWLNLDLQILMKIFSCPRGRSTKDFVNDCDEMWYLMTDKERMNLYLKYNQ